LFSIHSVSSDRELIFSAHHDEYFNVELKGAGLSMSTQVWAPSEYRSPNVFFQELASYTKPWQTEPGWESFEDEFAISATCTPFGNVIFQVKFSGQKGDREEWSGLANLETELGQIPIIARKANAFFHNLDA